MVRLEITDHEDNMDFVHQFVDALFQALFQVRLLMFIIFEVFFVLREELYLHSCDGLSEFLVHQNAVLILADVTNIIVNKINICWIADLLVADHEVAICVFKLCYCEQRFLEGPSKLGRLVEFGHVELEHYDIVSNCCNLEALVLGRAR